MKNETEVVLRLSSNTADSSDDETNFPRKLLLTNTQVTTLRKAFENYLSTVIKLSKTQLRYSQEGFLVDFLVHY